MIYNKKFLIKYFVVFLLVNPCNLHFYPFSVTPGLTSLFSQVPDKSSDSVTINESTDSVVVKRKKTKH